MYPITRPSCSSVRAPRNAGIISLKPRTGPPSCATAIQSPSGSRAAKSQSVKSGTSSSKARREGATPMPSRPWQLAHDAA